MGDDSGQGGDNDHDLAGTIDYVLDTSAHPPIVTVTTNTISPSTSSFQLFGFAIQGTTQDGFPAYSGIQGANSVDALGVRSCTNCRALSEGVGSTAQGGPQSFTFVAAASPAPVAPPATGLAAKWGGFVDGNNNGNPDALSEWDKLDDAGRVVSDNSPDNYVALAHPGPLRARLGSMLARIANPALQADSDNDNDKVIDANVNCPHHFNPDQRDSDGDGFGNVCDADFDGDGIVSLPDLVHFKSVFGSKNPAADLNGDGVVNLVDLVRFKTLFKKNLQ